MKPEVKALLDEILGPEPKPQPPKPKVVADAGRVVRDADVIVSPTDPNARHRGGDTGVSVRRAATMPLEPPLPPMRPGEVRVDMAGYTARRLMAEADREAERLQRRQIDPFGYGHWGPSDE